MKVKSIILLAASAAVLATVVRVADPESEHPGGVAGAIEEQAVGGRADGPAGVQSPAEDPTRPGANGYVRCCVTAGQLGILPSLRNPLIPCHITPNMRETSELLFAGKASLSSRRLPHPQTWNCVNTV